MPIMAVFGFGSATIHLSVSKMTETRNPMFKTPFLSHTQSQVPSF